MQEEQSLLKKFLSISIGSWIAMFIGFISTPITTRLISPDQFGQASIIVLIVDILSIIALGGADQSFIRFFYEEQEQVRNKLLKKTLTVSMSFFILIIPIFIVALKIPATNLSAIMSDSLVILVVLCVLLRILSTYASLVIRMRQNGSLYSIIQVLNKLLEFTGVLIFFFLLGNRYDVIIYSHLFFMSIVTIFAMTSQVDVWKFSKTTNSREKNGYRDIITFGFPAMITQVVTLLFQSVDKVSINEWSTYTELGLYSAAFKIIAILNMIQINFSAFWIPLSHEKFQNNPKDKNFFARIHEIAAFFLLLVTIGVLMFRDVIVRFLGQEYSDASSIMPFLVFVPIMYTISEITGVGINFYKKTKYHIAISVTALSLNCLGNFFFVPIFGATGAALSTGISYLVLYLLKTYISSKLFKVEYKLAKFSVCILLLLIFALFQTFFHSKILPFFFGAGLICMVLVLYKRIAYEIFFKIKEWILSDKGGKPK
ncbi:oligosaccharide flippase family protein [Enterococcus gilvus]|uniref:lipopolysaccharide biosynthesis protein n=1 Tax=Enterococcus gilvus TaxID=160453 RepID=UPI003D6A8391